MDHGRLNSDELVASLAEKDSLLCAKDAVIAGQQEQIAAQQVALDHAHEQRAMLKKALFGPRREHYVPPPARQLLLAAIPLLPAFWAKRTRDGILWPLPDTASQPLSPARAAPLRTLTLDHAPRTR